MTSLLLVWIVALVLGAGVAVMWAVILSAILADKAVTAEADDEIDVMIHEDCGSELVADEWGLFCRHCFHYPSMESVGVGRPTRK